jgi:hypothetical protein
LFADGRELARKPFPGLLPAQPMDGLQVGRDLAAPVGGYKTPFAFAGVIRSATLELGEFVAPAVKPFVGAVPAGGPVPRMDVKEQTQHPFPGRDRFGGDLRVQRKATGFFRTEQIGGRWFFITPEGHPFVALGPNHMGPFLRQQAKETGLWARFDNDPDKTAAGFLKTIHDLGFTAGDVYQPESTYTRTLPWITFFWYGPQNHSFVDVFDAAQMTKVRARVLAHAKSVADNPWVLGLGGPDLQVWDWKLVRQYRALPPDSAGRKRYAAFLRERHAGDIAKFNKVYGTSFASFDELSKPVKLVFPADAEDDTLDAWTLRWKLTVPPEKSANPPMQADNDAFCALIAETLFPIVRTACKEGAPNHLFLGEHLAVRMVPDAVLAAMGKHVDAYLAQAVEVSPQRPPEWQVFQRDRWDREHALLQKPIVIVDWGAVFSCGEPFDYKGATIKTEREASDDAAKFISDAFDAPYIIGLFVCKLLGDHQNDARFFNNRATRTYLKGDGTPYAYRTERLKQALHEAQKKVSDRAISAADRWTKERAAAWYAKQPFLAGANFIPSTAGNQLEMWMAETFDPVTIGRELGYAEKLGFNSMRVFLHDLLWKHDPAGLLDRMERYLAIADKRGIATMFVFFDSCWDPRPKWGRQPEPRPRTHNSIWVQSPGVEALRHPEKQAHLKPYVQGVIKHFANDPRILAWDLWNEPDNFDGGARATPPEPHDKPQLVLPLLKAAFGWAREVNPSQPLTSAVWRDIGRLDSPDATQSVQLENSDVISFHCYGRTAGFERTVRSLQRLGRSLFCTEYMARLGGGRFDPLLGFMREHKVAAYCWGFVNGRTQTIYPVSSWREPFTAEPPLWNNEILHADGTPYLKGECDYIRKVMGK